MSVSPPFNLRRWVDEHRPLLQPPVGNVAMWNSNFLVMVVGGPNRRSDYHINPGEELFFQVKAAIFLNTTAHPRPPHPPLPCALDALLPARSPRTPSRPPAP